MHRATVGGERFVFADLAELLAKANEVKSGDQLAGIAAASESERVAAKLALSDVRLGDLVAEPLVDDDVTRLVERRHDRTAFAELASLTVGELRELVLSREFPDRWSAGLVRAVTPEVAAAVTKLMSDKDLIVAASALRVVTRCRNTLGQAGTFGVRVQPNSPTDDVQAIVLSTLDGLLLACGDAVIGVNPARESVSSTAAVLHALHELTLALALPTQERARAHHHPAGCPRTGCAGRPALPVRRRHHGRERLLRRDARAARAGSRGGAGGARPPARAVRRGAGDVLRDRTGQRPFGRGARRTRPADAGGARPGGRGGVRPAAREQRRRLHRAGVPRRCAADHPRRAGRPLHREAAGPADGSGRLLHLPRGCRSQQQRRLAGAAGRSRLQLRHGVPGSDDVLLGYSSTSYHDAAGVRELFGRRPAPEFAAWCEAHGVLQPDGRLTPPDDVVRARLLAAVQPALGRS